MSVQEQLQSRSTAAGSSHDPWVELCIDPLNAPAVPYPDDWLHPTQATKLKMIIDIASDASGYFAYGVGHSLTTAVRTFTVTTANFTTTNTVLSHPDKVAYAAAFSRSRFLCSGMRYTPTQTPEKSSGSIGFLTVPEESLGSYQGIALTTLFTDCRSSSVHDPREEVKYNFGIPIFSTTHTYYDSAPTMLIIGRGCLASTTVGCLEIFWNVEGVSDPSSVHAGSSKVTAYNPEAITVATHVQQGATQTASTGKYSSSRHLTSTGRAIADASAAVVGTYMGGMGGYAIRTLPAGYRQARKVVKNVARTIDNSNTQTRKKKGKGKNNKG